MWRRCSVRVALTLLSLTITAAAAAGQDASPGAAAGAMLGFAPGSRAAAREAEAQALAVPSPESARAWLRTLTEEPHPAGSQADHRTALFVRDKLRSWGWQAELAEYEVLLNTPKRVSRGKAGTSPFLTLVRPQETPIPIGETPNPADKDSTDPDAFPPFHGYGVSGDVTGQVVYANYGQPEDFAALERMGVEVKGKVVLVRYGAIFRGLKVRNAQKRGATGMLIYSDPADDGYARGDVYPDGPFRPGSAVQRGSVQFLSLGPGDPSTPEGPSVKGAKRLPIDSGNGFTLSLVPTERPGGPGMSRPQPEPVLSIEQWEKATGLTRDDYFATIPSLPIGYDAARPILEALGGRNVPPGWQGGLPLAYHVGPGPAEVRFVVDMDYKVRTIWNVIATIRGSAEPDRWVMVGNHRDAWVHGAVDPCSGTAATLEACRALGAAVRNGWKPRRTLVYASWDAEEYGLVGSTEWADDHAKEIDVKALMLLNVDSAVGGEDLDLDGVPSLRDLMLEAADAVTDPRTGRSLRAAWTERRRAQWAATAPVSFADPLWDAPGEAAAPAAFSPALNPLGSGSDYTAFLDHLGVPCLDVGFVGRYGVYHSSFDNFYWMEKFGDPEFLTHATAARLYTALVMRAAGAEVVPFTFGPYSEALRDHLDDLRRTVERRARAVPPGAGRPFALEGLPALAGAAKGFQAAAQALDRATAEVAGRDGVEPARLARLNDALQRVERAFLLPDGLPGRPWFRHAIYAPGLTTGYACWPLPGVRQAVQDSDPKLLAAQTPALVARIDAATAALRAAAAEARAAAAGPREAARPAERPAAAPAAGR